jgi:hypothetical protein
MPKASNPNRLNERKNRNRHMVAKIEVDAPIDRVFDHLFVTLMSKVEEKQFHDQLKHFKGIVEAGK